MLDAYDTILCIIEAAEEKVAEESMASTNEEIVIGRTSIQKIAYFARQTCKNLVLSQFTPHFYGPYSSEVSIVLEDLVGYSFVDEKKIHGRRYDAYTYKLSKDGKTIIKDVKDKDAYENIGELVKRCYDACYLKSKPLSYAAKLHYILNSSKEKASIDELKIRGKELNWEIKDGDIKQGIDLLKKLKLEKNERLFCNQVN